MCGIVGAVAERSVNEILLDGLKSLEYRGYDSAGMAVLNDDGIFHRVRNPGKVKALEEIIHREPLAGHIGIAHTRWATHGEPVEHNAHPQMSQDDLALVHNGIIENHDALRDKLLQEGFIFTSETDTEVIAHLINYYRRSSDTIKDALFKAANDLKGSYALALILKHDPKTIYAMREGSPLVIGLGIEENFIASDQLALLRVAKEFIYLKDGDVAQIGLKDIEVFDKDQNSVERPKQETTLSIESVDKGPYRHFMQKEIFTQPDAINETLSNRISNESVLSEMLGVRALEIFKQVERLQIVACGTSYHAGMVARYWFEQYTGLPCQVEVASELRYRESVVQPNTLLIAISQSGETADTLAAINNAKDHYLATLGICNVAESSLVRDTDFCFMTRAGVEVGVASTKAFTTQLIALLLIAMVLRGQRVKDRTLEKQVVAELKALPRLVEEVLEYDRDIKALARTFEDKYHALYLGRGTMYPVAMEGALKLKEISYIHAEAYPAGELKHGPLALVDKDMPIVTVVPKDALLDKVKSNLHEVRARGGQILAFVDKDIELEPNGTISMIRMPSISPFLAPILYTIPLQLLSYHVAVIKGTDVDQPRNLAKSVTVE